LATGGGASGNAAAVGRAGEVRGAERGARVGVIIAGGTIVGVAGSRESSRVTFASTGVTRLGTVCLTRGDGRGTRDAAILATPTRAIQATVTMRG